jgi:PleD family two-component response regulator
MVKERLLIIEDDVDVAEMLTTYFSAQDYEVYHGITGDDGVSLARTKAPSLILLDVMLPDMDGFEVCRVLRTTPRTKFIPITFLTQRDERAAKVAGLELGADDYITKPFDLEELELRIKTSIRRANRQSLVEARTGLPTGPHIDEELGKALNSDKEWHYLDIYVKGFDAFRDSYGFVAADDILGQIARMFVDLLSDLGTDDDFLGNPGEEHFVIFTYLDDPTPMIEAADRMFKQVSPHYYNFIDRERGYTVMNPGTGYEREIPLMSLEISVKDPWDLMMEEEAS